MLHFTKLISKILLLLNLFSYASVRGNENLTHHHHGTDTGDYIKSSDDNQHGNGAIESINLSRTTSSEHDQRRLYQRHLQNEYHTVIKSPTQSHDYRKNSSSIPIASVDNPLVKRAYAPYSEGHSIAISSLDTEVRFRLERDLLDVLSISGVPSNLTDAQNSGVRFIQTLYKKFNIKSEGKFAVNPADATIELPVLGPTAHSSKKRPNPSDESIMAVEQLDWSTQDAINRSDTIHSCFPIKDLFDKQKLIHFDLGKVITHETPILGAQLRFYKIDSDPKVKGLTTIRGHTNTRDQSSQVEIESDRVGWITMNLTEAIREWSQDKSRDSSSKFSVELLGWGPHANFNISNSDDSGLTQFQPFLVIYLLTRDTPARPLNFRGFSESQLKKDIEEMKQSDPGNTTVGRPRRSLKQQPVRSSEKSIRDEIKHPIININHKKFCNKHHLYVDFKELNWDAWIIAPAGFEASYCTGTCPFPLPPNYNSTSHAIVQYMAHLMNNDIPAPCCAPTKLQPVTVLYYIDHLTVVLKTYRNMIVQSCGCV